MEQTASSLKYQGIKQEWITTVGVLRDLRRKGIGTSLILHCMKLLKSKGMTEVALGVDDSNPTKAMELYEKAGFKVIFKDPTYLKKKTQVIRKVYINSKSLSYLPITRTTQNVKGVPTHRSNC